MIKDILLSGESVFCLCGHHIICHNTKNGRSFSCDFESGHNICKCDGFIAYKIIDDRFRECIRGRDGSREGEIITK
ncbi:MAG: hypothetical protein ACR2KF_08555 [Nitrososphaeraceae archaeon]